MSHRELIPVLKWAGGKRWLVSRHPGWLRHDAVRYLEPFFGSGAVFFHLCPRRAILSDLNGELMFTYRALRDDPGGVKRHLRRHQRLHCRGHYYQVRSQELRAPAARAARFIYLNRICFNGLYRVNLGGVFNVPKGTRDSVVLPSDDFEEVARVLRSKSIVACDFTSTVGKAGEGDFLYVDPPYTVRHNTNNFLKYNESIFSWSDQKRLATCLAEAAKRGVSILVSNADHPCIHSLYSKKLWQRLRVERFSRIASSRRHRRETSEIVISNYLEKDGDQGSPRS